MAANSVKKNEERRAAPMYTRGLVAETEIGVQLSIHRFPRLSGNELQALMKPRS